MADLKGLGRKGEDFAAELLRKRGHKLLARNYNCAMGELDLVSWHNDTLVFTEVRARTHQEYGSAAESVSRAKQNRIKRAAQHFCMQGYKGRALPACRFDVVWLVAKDNEVAEFGVIEGAFC